MASEIMSDLPRMLMNDMPESSMEREPQGIMINQGSLNNLIDCITQLKKELQQISEAQMKPQELKKEATHPTLVPPGLLSKDEEEFQVHLSHGNCAELLKMVKNSPAELFLRVVDEKYSRSALHVAVLEGSKDLICALMEKLNKLSGGNDSKLDEHSEFILKKDKSGLSAADMAALIGNKKMISCISEQGLHVPDDLESDNPSDPSPASEVEKTKLLEEASLLLETLVSMEPSDQGTRQLSLREWLRENNIDFVYCLHEATKVPEFEEHIYSNKESKSLLERLLKVRDSLGKSPLHAHVDNPNFETLFQKLVTHFRDLDWDMPDFCGRTPLHWAAAQGKTKVVTFLIKQTNATLDAKYGDFDEKKMETSTNSNYGKVSYMTPLHLAVIHNHVEVVEALLEAPKARKLDVNALCRRQINLLDRPPKNMLWTPIQLAAYMGHKRILRKFLKDPRTYDPGLMNGSENLGEHNGISALHLAASQFYPSAIKTLVDCRKMNTLVEDEQKNTALHYATKHAHGKPQVHPSLFDYVTISHFTSKPPKPRDPSDHDINTCMDILMQSGVHMESRNEVEKTPNLHRNCPPGVKSWWLGKLAKEYQEVKNNLITAANAVSVTAALVATASFVGPLQPPLGLLDDGNETWLDGYSQVKHTSVQVFIFCDNLSFYLAISAIVFAMLPSWPLPHEGLVQEVSIARRCVQVSVLLLFGSIIFVICAFTAASISIVPDKRWQYMTIAVISTILGVLICFTILFLSFMRLLALFPSNNEVAKKISDVATRILIWEPNTSRTNKKVPKPNE